MLNLNRVKFDLSLELVAKFRNTLELNFEGCLVDMACRLHIYLIIESFISLESGFIFFTDVFF